jgi:STE24 endopeptidase
MIAAITGTIRTARTTAALACALVVSLAGTLTATTAVAQAPATASQPLVRMAPVPAGAQFDAAGHLDVDKATRAYLDTIPADKRASSNKYFEGKYWLLLWDALFSIIVMLVLLFSGASSRMKDFAVRLTRFQWLQAWLYFAGFTVVTTIVGFPLTLWESFYRERMYGQSEQAFSGWLRDQLLGAAIGLVLGGIVVATLYAVVRKLPQSWHLWGSVVTIAFLIVLQMVGPVYLAPVFNTYTPLNNPQVTVPILKMAHANGIGVDKLYEVDASRQTTNVSANVSGLFGTTRITLNDNLLHQASLEEIETVTGHEMGHYVLHHIPKMLSELAILIFIYFALLKVWVSGMQTRWGKRWGTNGIADVALLPAVAMAFTVMGLLSTPILNTLTRTQEFEADMYGLNAARQPDGEAQIDLKLGQYRKMEPGPVEEFLFFDHPSGYVRVHAAMLFKSETGAAPGN